MTFDEDLSDRELARVKNVQVPFCLGCDHRFSQAVILRGFAHELECPECGATMTVDEARGHNPEAFLDEQVARIRRFREAETE